MEEPSSIDGIPHPASPTSRKDDLAAERVLTFKTLEDLRNFVAVAGEHGTEPLAMLAQLKSLRVRIKDSQSFADFIKHQQPPIEVSGNYVARIPEPVRNPDSADGGGYQAFGDQAIHALNIPGDHGDWGKGVQVAILDSGIDSHPTFAGKNVQQLNLSGAQTAMGDLQGHGTAVASLVAGSSPHAQGVAPMADLLSIRVISEAGTGDTFTVAQGIVEAVDHGAKVINLSLGSQEDSAVLKQAVDYALQKNVALVAAVGNESVQQISYPARYPGVFSVSSVDANMRHVGFANSGPQVDFTAPGVGVQAAGKNDSIVSMSGTSASAPLVTGLIAGLLSKEPQLSPIEAGEIIREYSNDLGPPGPDPFFGQGMPNMERVSKRNTRGIFRAGISGNWLASDSHHPSRSTIFVGGQNRGTEVLPVLRLEVSLNGREFKETFYNVPVNKTVSLPLTLDAQAFDKGGVTVSSTVSVINSAGQELSKGNLTTVFKKN